MKKLLAMGLAVAMAVSAVGCSQTPSKGTEGETAAAKEESTAAGGETGAAETEKGELTVWVSKVFSDEANAAIEARALDFGAENGVAVTIEEIKATDLTNIVNAAVEAGVSVLPDVILWSSYGKFMYYYPDLINREVTDLFEEINAEHPFIGKRSEGSLTIDNEQYAVPFYNSPTLMYIRKDAMEAAGVTEVPETWDEVFDLAYKISDATDMYGLGWGCGPNDEDCENNTRMMLWGQGAFELSENGFNESELYEDWANRYVQMYQDGVIPVDATTWGPSGNNNSYLAEESAIVFNASTLTRALKMDHPELYENTVIANMPSTGEPHLYDCSSAWTIMRESQNQELAEDFVRWMMDYEWYSTFIEECAPVFCPIYQEIADTDFWRNDPDHLANVLYTENADAMHSYPSKEGKMVSSGIKIYQAYGFCNLLSSMINGESFADAWSTYQTSVQEILDMNIK